MTCLVILLLPVASLRYSMEPSGDNAMPLVRCMPPSSLLAVPVLLHIHSAPVLAPHCCPLRNKLPFGLSARSFGTPSFFMPASVQKSLAALFALVSTCTTAPRPTSAR